MKNAVADVKCVRYSSIMHGTVGATAGGGLAQTSPFKKGAWGVRGGGGSNVGGNGGDDGADPSGEKEEAGGFSPAAAIAAAEKAVGYTHAGGSVGSSTDAEGGKFSYRIDGRNLTLVPYSKLHVPTVHKWMQVPDMHRSFGVPAPTIGQEHAAFAGMQADANCHPFIVCTRDTAGEVNVLHSVGRAQLVATGHGRAQVYIGIPEQDSRKKADIGREALLMLMLYAVRVLSVNAIHLVKATACLPTPEPYVHG